MVEFDDTIVARNLERAVVVEQLGSGVASYFGLGVSRQEERGEGGRMFRFTWEVERWTDLDRR